MYNNLVNDVTQGFGAGPIDRQQRRLLRQTLNNQQVAASGVSIDQQTIQMLEYQAEYQATAKYVGTLSNLLQLLAQL